MSDEATQGETKSAPKPRRKASRLAKLGLLVGSLFVAVSICEIALRILGIPAEELAFLPKDGSVDWDCYSTNYRNYFVPRTLPSGQTVYCVDHANEPLRERSLKEAQAGGAFTVLAVGDSFTYGLGVKVADSWPHRLQALLTTKLGKPAIVSNVGKVGRHVMEVLTEQYFPHSEPKPDLCVYGFCLNDPLWMPAQPVERSDPLAPTTKDERMETGQIDDFINIRTANLKRLRIESPLAGIRKQLRTVDVTLRAWEARQIQRRTLQHYLDLYDPAKNGGGLETTWNAIQQIQARQRLADKRLLLVVFPMFVDTHGDYPLQRCHDAVVQAMRARGIEVLDLLPIYRNTPTKDLWVHPLDRHPNDVAHRLCAEAIAGAL